MNLVGSFLEESRANLGSLGIQQDRNIAFHVFGSRSKTLQHSTVTYVVTMAKVKPCHIHSSRNEFGQVLHTPAGGANGANDFGASQTGILLFLDDLRQVNHATCQSGDR